MKDALMIVVEETFTVDRLEMTYRILTNTDGFDPYYMVLKYKNIAQSLGDIPSYPRIGVGTAHIEKIGTIWLKEPTNFQSIANTHLLAFCHYTYCIQCRDCMVDYKLLCLWIGFPSF